MPTESAGPLKEVVVLGAGFGGLAAARQLAQDPALHITVIDQRNYHLFQPLLYQVATAGLNPSDIAVPIRAQFTGLPNVAVHLGHVKAIDRAHRVVLREGTHGDVRVPYDYLVVACGAQHSYFGHDGWEEFAPGLKTLEQATEIRRRILAAFEEAENESDPQRQRALLDFVVVGGGPTGVELAGAIADIARTVLVRDFRRINPADARVVLLEAGDRVLAAFSPDLSAHAEADLKSLGVEVLTGARVGAITADYVEYSEPPTQRPKQIAAKNVFWAAWVVADGVTRSLGVPLDRAGRVLVAPDLSVPGHPEIFVIGDAAAMTIDGKSVPGVAPAAIQGGRHVATNIAALARGGTTTPFHYFDKGSMATIGKQKAVVEVGKMKFSGLLAWLAWLVVHIFSLTGFRNRWAVFAQWVWSYLFSKRGARLITARDWRSHLPPTPPTPPTT